MICNIPYSKDVPLPEVKEFLFDPKWEQCRTSIDAYNTHKSERAKSRITKETLEIRKRLLALGYDVYPCTIRTYAKQSDQFKWIMLTPERFRMGCTESTRNLIKYPFISVLRHDNVTFEAIGEYQ